MKLQSLNKNIGLKIILASVANKFLRIISKVTYKEFFYQQLLQVIY